MSQESLQESVDQDCTRNLLVVSRKKNREKREIAAPDGNSEPVQMERYIIQKQIGEGAFGCVFLAVDEILDRRVAVKVARRAADKEYLAEARTVAKLDHPNIVPVYDVGRTAEGHFCIVSKYVEGSDLHRVLADSDLSIRDAVNIIATVSEALGFAHHRSVIHRDVKPANILVDAHGRPFVTDFGVATQSRCSIRDGQFLAGTPLYMSPEQVECTSYLLDARSDIFSLGVVLYELLTGTVPFAAESIEELKEKIAHDNPKSPSEINPEVPRSLSAICMRAMAKQRDSRYQTAGEFAADLQKWLDQADVEVQAVESAPQRQKDRQPQPTVRKSRARNPKFRKRIRLVIAAWIAAMILTPLVSIYGKRGLHAWTQTQAVSELIAAGSTVVYDYQVQGNGEVDLTAPAPFLRDWSNRVQRVHLGAEVIAHEIDGDIINVINTATEHCSIEPLVQLKSLQHVSLYQHFFPGELEILCSLTNLKSIEFHFEPARDEFETLREHLPHCKITFEADTDW